jgi:hypothetical protein
MTYKFSEYNRIPEKIQNWICEQSEYPSKGLGRMTVLDLETINRIVNKRYNPTT